ncbi:ferredoxin-NADP reductase [Buchnera aphidicola str. Bp (Baizongia pistaciae)]|uniref:Flavodoxin/ferredoxin--NADP reductase n=1 Tax=Buchnera aphidicola subsp. Baizongia pistaciae (strain Bp) TaxID=224915 RepID=FENR_BUCBP|nr:ferredoxin--NADP reductase [Buchnera aphidicola]Q89A28.1 RecName: Full=Flavodoxin/ferredoxin--NADP reductase; AltName: Full=Ferredoxin (flavodoxin):NADP(+) oxidoreductase; AltName: Full=Ferredoxin--NADP reductase; Short=FNR; AltName: Full=Flavodoxin--NADP reductase; Short=FLDR [Buchnera aphidicola str. Bp (Baizongia pistaciae)]AAO27229.1 ferredoxin-NADP reductase [Buchnera aphidicola str. Bp (Baizongia pistaciae)]
MNTWITAKIIKIKKWKNNLFSVIVNAPISPFTAGQFTKLGYQKKNGKIIQRAYSFVNAPHEKNLEFYMVLIKNGQLTTKLYNLNNTDHIQIKKKSYGFFTLNEIPTCKILWMFATGTGIGPYLSMLKYQKNTEKFQKIVLIHAVRYRHDLTYFNEINNLKNIYNKKLYTQFIISREKTNFSLSGRIPQLLKTEELEKHINLFIENNTSHVMLCGNPDMVKQTQNFLINNKNMKKHLRRKPGQISSENYW